MNTTTTTMSQRKERGCISCVKSLLIVSNSFLMLVGTAVAGVFVWMAVDQLEAVAGVTGSSLALVSVCLLVCAGVLLILSACLGITAAASENYVLTVVYTAFVAVILTFFASASVCVAVFKLMLTEPMKLEMEESLRHNYGNYMQNNNNQHITQAWNTAQIKWQCCGAADKSWAIYQESTWFKVSFSTDGQGTDYVPESCCERYSSGEIKDPSRCQHTKPPDIGDQYARETVPVYQRGCYETLKDFFLDDQLSWFTGIFWTGIAGCILMLLVLVLSIAFTFQVKRENKLQRLRSTDFEFDSKPSHHSSVHSHLILNSPTYQTPPPAHSLSLRQTAPNQYMYSMA